jgi:hypothetical protein
VRNVEIQEQSELVPTQTKIGEQLGTMYRKHSFNAFEFDDEAFLDDEVDAIRRSELNSFVNDRQGDLVLETQSGLRQLPDLRVLGVLCVESTPVQGLSRI